MCSNDAAFELYAGDDGAEILLVVFAKQQGIVPLPAEQPEGEGEDQGA